MNKQIEKLNELLTRCNKKLDVVEECIDENGINEDLEYHKKDLEYIIRELQRILN